MEPTAKLTPSRPGSGDDLANGDDHPSQGRSDAPASRSENLRHFSFGVRIIHLIIYGASAET